MEDQIVQAIQIAWDPKAAQNLKVPAFEYVNGLRQSPQAWQPCLFIFAHLPRHAEVVRVFSLEIVVNAIRAGIVDQQGLMLVKQHLFSYLEETYKTSAQDGSKAPDSYTIENKIAQVVTYLFCGLYSDVWPSFFDDLLNLTNTPSGHRDNLVGVAFYLRVINSIHDEIGDVLQARSKEEQDRANTLKDLVRTRDMRKIAQSWQEILTHWRVTNGTVGELAMQAVGRYVSWIDISLVVNSEMLQLISQQIEQNQVEDIPYPAERARDCAVDALTEIVSKKMSHSDKIQMMDFIGIQAIVEKISNWSILCDQKKSIYDVDLAEIVAKLVNAIVLDIVRALENEQQNSDTWRRAEQMLRSFLPQLLRYFSDVYDDVCSNVLQAMTDVLAFMRRAFQGDEFVSQRTTLLLPILAAILEKSRFDPYSEYDELYGDENTEEAEFLEFRKRLSNLQSSIAATDEQLYIDFVSDLVNRIFEQLQVLGQTLDWRDLDLALHEMYILGDLAIKSGGLYQKNKPNSPPAEKLVRMMLLLVQSSIGSYPTRSIQVQYMELCVRYASFFEKHAGFVRPVLENFLQFAHSQTPRVKFRSWYLLMRFIRLQRHNVGPVADTIVPNMLDLLVIKAESSTPDADKDSDPESDEETGSTIFTHQLDLFEALGCIISTTNVPTEKQIQYAQMVMQPIFTDLQNNMAHAKTNMQASAQVHHDLMAFASIARGYHDVSGPNAFQAAANVPPAIGEAFGQVAEVTLMALQSLKSSPDIRAAARYTFTRVLTINGQQMLPQLPSWVDGFLTESSTKEEMTNLLRVLDQITYGFKNDVFNFLDALFGGLVQRIWAGISATTSGTDDEVELADLKREYLNFLLVILGNGLGGILVSSTNQPHFETVISSIEHFTKDIGDPTAAKMAFQLLGRMCIVWGGSDAVPNQIPTDMSQAQAAELPGFKQFMMTRFSPLAWALPANPNFNPKDGQSRLVLLEAAGLQKTIYAKNGEDYITYMRTTELPGLGLQGKMMDDFFNKLKTLDVKSWKSWFAKFVTSGGAV